MRDPSLKTRKILVVDDDLDIRDMLRLDLNLAGYAVKTARNGETARRLLQNDSFHLAVIDLALPDVDGFEILSFIKRVAPATRTVMISGLDSIDVASECTRRGADAFIGKPFSLDRFNATIRLALREDTLPVA